MPAQRKDGAIWPTCHRPARSFLVLVITPPHHRGIAGGRSHPRSSDDLR